MKTRYYLTLFFILVSSILGYSQNYYWAKNEKLPLEEYHRQYFILVEDSRQDEIVDSIIAKISTMSEFFQVSIENKINKKNYNASIGASQYSWAYINSTERIVNLEKNENISYSSPAFIINGKIVGISNFFYVYLKSEKDTDILEDYARKTNTEIVGQNTFMPKLFVLSCNNKTKKNSLEVANYFFESGNFASSVPDFIEDDNLNCVNDS